MEFLSLFSLILQRTFYKRRFKLHNTMEWVINHNRYHLPIREILLAGGVCYIAKPKFFFGFACGCSMPLRLPLIVSNKKQWASADLDTPYSLQIAKARFPPCLRIPKERAMPVPNKNAYAFNFSDGNATTRSILKRAAASTAWGTLAGITML